MRYRIAWRSEETGKTGHEKSVFDALERAADEVRKMNKEFPLIYHWVEEVRERQLVYALRKVVAIIWRLLAPMRRK